MSEGYSVKVRPEKVQAIQEIKERFERAGVVVLTEYRGLTVGELATLRSALADAEVEYRVVKNTLAKRAAADVGIEGLDEWLEGPTAIAYCYGDPVNGSKALTSFAKDHPGLVIKGGLLEGRVMTADEAKDLATVDPLEGSLAKIAGSLTSPLAGIIGVLEAPLQRILYVLEQGAAAGAFGPAAATEAPAEEATAAAPEAEAAAEAPEAGPTEESPVAEAAEEAPAAEAAGTEEASGAGEEAASGGETEEGA